ncbi:MAG TPA: hypothetical protein VGO57_08345 [Verrucomicrobiae bacterium]|jgi:hypothetical protein
MKITKLSLPNTFATIAMLAAATFFSTASRTQAQTYYNSGDFINGWANPQGSLMSGGPAAYTNVIVGGTPGNYQQLKVTDGTWNNAWPGNNLQIKFDAGGSNTIYFYPGIATDGWTPLQNRVGYADPGNMAWEVTGDFTTPSFGSDPNAQMTSTGNGLYKVTYTIPTAGAHQFKFRTPNTWSEANFGVDFGNGSGNASVTTTTANQAVLFQLDLPNGRWVAGNPAPGPVTNQVVFAVDMSVEVLAGRFNPSLDTAFVSGVFNNWPGIGAGALVLTNFPTLNGNTNLYYATNTIINLPGSSYEYKFTDNDPAWSGSGGYEPISQNRTFSLLSSNGVLVLPTVLFGNAEASDYLSADTTVIFTINMTNATTYPDGHVFDPNNDSIFINGNFISGGWTSWNPIALNQMLNNPAGSQIYQFSYVVPKGSPILLDYKFSMGYSAVTNYDNEAPAYQDHFRYIRATATGTYTMPMDTFGNQYSEPQFGELKAIAGSAGAVSVAWLGRPGVHLQTTANLSGGGWQDIQATDGTNWTTGYLSPDGFISQTNYQATGQAFFRLIKP